MRFFVEESELGKMQIGAPLEIRMDGLAAPLAGKVSFVSPQAEYTLPSSTAERTAANWSTSWRVRSLPRMLACSTRVPPSRFD